MENNLKFNQDKYVVNSLEIDGEKLVYRAFENITYVKYPVNEDTHKLSIYVPEAYYAGKSINGYDIKTAPIFFPNNIGGYMPGTTEGPGKNFMGETNSAFYALLHGYIVVSSKARGRMMKGSSDEYIGMAPAGLCDLKAAIRYLRYNKDAVPGDTEKIITNGTSAGGAMSSLLGATGNHPDYEEYLEKIGAAEAEDNIFAASCYCPITNLDHADMAYEWEFNGLNDFHTFLFHPDETLDKKFVPFDGVLTEEQNAMSVTLKSMFPQYLNSLNLMSSNGTKLTLDKEGNGTFKNFIKAKVISSANDAITKNTDLSNLDWLTIENGKAVDIDFPKYIKFRTRMKETPAFDNVKLGTPENELFGSETVKFRHFTEFSKQNSKVNGEMADGLQIKMMNPMNYIEDSSADKAKYYRIRHGSVDRDTSLAISAMLALKLKNNGVDVNFAYPWGKPHSGDYDLKELFAWIDEISR